MAWARDTVWPNIHDHGSAPPSAATVDAFPDTGPAAASRSATRRPS